MAAGSETDRAPEAGQPPQADTPAMTTLRNTVAAVLGIVTSFALFWVMQALINVVGELQEAGGRSSIEFVRLRKDTAPEVKERE